MNNAIHWLGIYLVIFATVSVARQTTPALEKNLRGTWVLKALKCNNVPQLLESMDYSLSFNGNHGEYISKNKGCQQNEPEIYSYPTANTVGIKSGVRTCAPNPCAADLAATECGKEANLNTPIFNVEFKNKYKTMILSTSDPKSVDCIGPDQKKPASFTFSKNSGLN